MKLIAKRPCSFGGKRFFVGDEIPCEYVADPAMQEKMGVLMQIDTPEGAAPEETAPADEQRNAVVITIPTESGGRVLALTVEGIQAVVDVMTRNATDAEPIIEQMHDGETLALLYALDSRKSIKAAAEIRAKSINGTEGQGEG